MTKHRATWVSVHRWLALTIGLWFVVLGLTGSVLAWRHQLEPLLNPQWFAAPAASVCSSSPSPADSALAVYRAAVPEGKPVQVMMPAVAGAPLIVWDKPGPLRRQHFVDVNCGEYLGSRLWGAVRFDREHLIPTLYELHRAMLLRETGHTVSGFIGLFLLVVLISGIVVGLPRYFTRPGWSHALRINARKSRAVLWYTLHRAVGLWTFIALLALTLTGTYISFPKQSRAVIETVLPSSPAQTEFDPPVVASPAALDSFGTAAVAQLPAGTQWTRIVLPGKDKQSYEVRLLQPAEWREQTGETRARFALQGKLSEVADPLRTGAANRFISWLFPVHSGEFVGLPGRLLWTLVGLVPLAMYGSGVWLWLRARRARSRPGRTEV